MCGLPSMRVCLRIAARGQVARGRSSLVQSSTHAAMSTAPALTWGARCLLFSRRCRALAKSTTALHGMALLRGLADSDTLPVMLQVPNALLMSSLGLQGSGRHVRKVPHTGRGVWHAVGEHWHLEAPLPVSMATRMAT